LAGKSNPGSSGSSKALWQQFEKLGIEVLMVEPHGSRTNWARHSAKDTRELIDDVAKTAGQTAKMVRDTLGKQSGDPNRVALAIITVVELQDVEKT